jgi:hypothetical protein
MVALKRRSVTASWHDVVTHGWNSLLRFCLSGVRNSLNRKAAGPTQTNVSVFRDCKSKTTPCEWSWLNAGQGRDGSLPVS